MTDDVEQPEHATYKLVYHERGFPQCGKCKRTLPASNPSYRCPYVACREWLIGFGDPQPARSRREHA